ncbi:MAG: CDP-alcohol phosphatidyltransferase family protein [Clostridia bacterium]|nr:CDP-alcohol phosphatidyltransferase family protein [Clostridia bacterium]
MSEEKDRSSKIFTIPNVISMFRILLIPFFIWTYALLHNSLLTVILLAISGVSDVLDGFIARKFNMVSDLGKALDPVADKLTQLAMIFCLVFRFNYMVIPFILLAIKEIIAATTGMAVIKATNKVRSAEWHGKAATACIYVMMIMHVVWDIFFKVEIPFTVSVISVAVTTAVILLSFILYTSRNIRLIREAKKDAEK